LADLREADFTGADLTGASFAGARVFGVVVKDVRWSGQPGVVVDTSPGDGEKVMQPFDEWIRGRITIEST
jgi:Pentapeptide repeats (8 copies)